MKYFLVYLVFATFIAFGACQRRNINGQIASPGQFPHQVSLQVDGKHFCGGTIIDKKWIVTAAQCTFGLAPEKITVVAGITNLNDKTGQKFQVIKKVEHEKYSENRMLNDISLLMVNRSMKFSDTVKPIELSNDYIRSGVPVTLIGWGDSVYLPNFIKRLLEILLGYSFSPDELQFVELETISNEQCAEAHKFREYNIDDKSMCTSVRRESTIEDSGSPLVYRNKLVGIISWRIPYSPDVYTRVCSYINWIKKNTN